MSTELIPEGYSRVTEVLAPYTRYDHIDAQVLAKAAERGTRVHHFCEMYSRNLLITDVDDDCNNYFKSYVEWFDEMVEDVVIVEQRINSAKYKLSGKCDLVVTLKGDGGRLSLIDIKTPQLSNKTWNLQTAAYRMLLRDEMRVSVDRRICIMLAKQDSSARVCEHDLHDVDESLYLKALDLHRFFGYK